MKKIIYQFTALCTFALAMNIEVKAQDPEFTQFYSNPLYLNPAFAGSKKCPRIVMNYRNQWPNISGNFVTTSVAYDQRVDGLNGGLGFIVMQDNAAQTLKTLRASAIYAYSINVTRKFTVNLGAEATFFQKSLDWNKLTFGDMIDPRRGFVYQTNDVPRGGTASGVDFSAGILGFSDKFYFGFAAHHLN
jgi:type IX secretion system PorP/SprF family membrane protein